MRRLLLLTLLTAVTPCVSAQRMVSGHSHMPFGYSRAGHPEVLALFDPFSSNDLSRTGFPAASQSPVIIVQPPSWAPPAPDPSPSPAQPLLIELQGDRYVRVSGPETLGAEMIAPQKFDQAPHPPRRQERRSVAAVAAPELPPAVLVFRDGHREEASDYTIADGILYTRGDYTNGSWNRKIELSSLNLPETVKSNQSRGVRFQLPTAPNEVIVRP
jgi:hypothetical protein